MKEDETVIQQYPTKCTKIFGHTNGDPQNGNSSCTADKGYERMRYIKQPSHFGEPLSVKVAHISRSGGVVPFQTHNLATRVQIPSPQPSASSSPTTTKPPVGKPLARASALAFVLKKYRFQEAFTTYIQISDLTFFKNCDIIIIENEERNLCIQCGNRQQAYLNSVMARL